VKDIEYHKRRLLYHTAKAIIARRRRESVNEAFHKQEAEFHELKIKQWRKEDGVGAE